MRFIDFKINYKPRDISKEFVAVKYDINGKNMESNLVYIDGIEFEGAYISEPIITTGDVLMFVVPREYHSDIDTVRNLAEKLVSDARGDVMNHKVKIHFTRITELENVLAHFKSGKPIGRVSWNGKKIIYRKGYCDITPNQQTIEQWGISEHDYISVDPHIQMKDGHRLSEYVFTADDIAADDWFIIR